MLSVKRIQRLYKSSLRHTFPASTKLPSMANKQIPVEALPKESHLSRDQVLEIYDWISQINSQSNHV